MRGALRRGRWMRCGRPLTTTLARDAKVLSFGDGSHRALGHTDCFGGDAYEPEEVTALPEDIRRHRKLGRRALPFHGGVTHWRALGLGPKLGRAVREKWHVLQRVRGLESVEVTSARGSGVVSMAVAKDGFQWGWGKSKRGQLGLGSGITQAAVPQRVEALSGKQVVQMTNLTLGWGMLSLSELKAMFTAGVMQRTAPWVPDTMKHRPMKPATIVIPVKPLRDVAFLQVLADM